MSKNIYIIKDCLFQACNKFGINERQIGVEQARGDNNGHFASNIAMILAKKNQQNPMIIANQIVEQIKKTNDLFEKIEVASPGFINFTLKTSRIVEVINEIKQKQDNYGKSANKNFTYNLELVSANPTGFLHVGHARNGAIGDSTARILKFAGYNVQTEHYTNDAGNQINILAITVFYYYLKLLGKNIEPPSEYYAGDMYSEVAQEFIDEYQDQFATLTFENNKIQDEKVHMLFRIKATEKFLNSIKDHLKLFKVNIDHYSSEKAMYENRQIETMLEKYKQLNVTYQQDDALWLKTTDYGDDKDRVLIKKDGSYTYITPDLATHYERLTRSKADKLVNFWGGDHHGYIKRLQAGLELQGWKNGIVDIDVIQMVRLIKNGQEYKMSKRKGTAIWLIDLIEDFGVDPIRYMLISKTASSHMDVDLDLISERTSKNPVFYAQYATTRCYGILQQALKMNIDATCKYDLLIHEKELKLLIKFDLFNKTVEDAAKLRHPHVIADYIQNIAKLFHTYYQEIKIVDPANFELSSQRIELVKVVYRVLSNAFNLIGISVINKM